MQHAEMVRFEDVSFHHGSAAVVDHLALSVARGEMLVLLGRSGSGKTTTLKLVNRLLSPGTGRVFVDGRDAAEWDPIALRRLTGYVIQEAGLFPHFKVSRNVGLVPELEGWPREKRDARIREALDLVGLPPAEYGDRFPDQLSGGQRQRVGVARALAADPPLLLMDEPFGALDPLTRAQLQNEFRNLRKTLGKTILFVTHDVAEALLLGDRIAVLDHGRLIQAGTPAEIMSSQEATVQAFLQPVREQIRSLNTLV